jgi:hypothetical protein
MPSERDKANGDGLKWWYFRPWSPIIVWTVIGAVWSGLMTPGVGNSRSVMEDPNVKGVLALIIGAVAGAVVGVLLEQFSQAVGQNK